MKKFNRFLFIIAMFSIITAEAQVGIGTTTPAASSQLDVSSTTKGLLPPRMTAAQRIAIPSPAEGLLVYQTDSSKGYYLFNGSDWRILNVSSAIGSNLPSTKICDQIWMTVNLDVTTYRNGDPIPQVTDNAAWAALATGAWCWYNNDSATYAATYGKLYNWYAVNDSRGLAPLGWHIPTDVKWTTLTTCLGGEPLAGGRMKATATSLWITPNFAATNSSGLAGLPGGARYIDGTFSNVGYAGYWWSATEGSTTSAWFRTLIYANAEVFGNYYIKTYGYSVRCVRD